MSNRAALFIVIATFCAAFGYGVTLTSAHAAQKGKTQEQTTPAVPTLPQLPKQVSPKLKDIPFEILKIPVTQLCVPRSLEVSVCTRKLYVGPSPVKGKQSPFSAYFSSITQALQSPAESSCAVNIVVSSSNLREDLHINRDASITGAAGQAPTIRGLITIDGPYSVSLKNIHVVGGRDGAIDVKNSCAALTVVDARISNANSFGIRQTGGRLSITDTLIDRIARPFDGTPSAALNLGSGVKARLNNVDFQFNDHRAIWAHDNGTDVDATNITIEGTRISPTWFRECPESEELNSGFGAVEVSDGAIVTLQGNLRRNDFVGLNARADGQIVFRGGAVQETPSVDIGCRSRMGGFGVVAQNRGRITLLNFNISNSELCGIVVHEGGDVVATDGTISDSPVGACVQGPEFDPSKLMNNVAYRNVGAPLQAPRYSPPDASADLD